MVQKDTTAVPGMTLQWTYVLYMKLASNKYASTIMLQSDDASEKNNFSSTRRSRGQADRVFSNRTGNFWQKHRKHFSSMWGMIGNIYVKQWTMAELGILTPLQCLKIKIAPAAQCKI